MNSQSLIKGKVRMSMNIMIHMFGKKGIKMKKICRTCTNNNNCKLFCPYYSNFDVDDAYINTLIEEEVGNIDCLIFVLFCANIIILQVNWKGVIYGKS